MCVGEYTKQYLPDKQLLVGRNHNTFHYEVGIVTYNVRHRKTYDTLCLLNAKGYRNVVVYAQPMHYQKKFFPLIRHRPDLGIAFPDLSVLCQNLGYTLFEGDINKFEIPGDMPLLVCGAGIIPYDFVQSHTLINAHPGYIPMSRGLDSFKWAIWEGKPLGVTTHILGSCIDAGEIIERKMINITPKDTFFEAASRVYENEISMLVDSLEHLNEEHLFIAAGDNELHKRMPHEIEKQLLVKFEEYKNNEGIYKE